MKQKNLSAEEQLTKVVVLVCDYLADFIRDKVPQSGHFQPFGVRFDVYGTENQGMMRVEHHTTAPKEERSVSLHVIRKGYDRAYTHFLLKGTNAELIEALRSEAKKQEFLQAVRSLSQSVDDYYD